MDASTFPSLQSSGLASTETNAIGDDRQLLLQSFNYLKSFFHPYFLHFLDFLLLLLLWW